jgi:Ca-activated chloride channel family protein
VISLGLPWALLLLPLPFLVWRLVPPHHEPVPALRFPFFRRIVRTAGAEPGPGAVVLTRSRLQMGAAIAAWCLMVLALAQPERVGAPVEVNRSARDVVLAIDISGSMDARDFAAPDDENKQRLETVRDVVRTFVEGREGDRMALIVFGSKAYVQAPLTFDLRAVAEMVGETFIGLAGEGTALGDAIALGVARLRAMQRDERVLVLLTDGSSTDGTVTVEDAARLARLHGVRVHAIGIGTPRNDAELRPGEGLDENALKLVAAASGGQYFRAEHREALERIYEALERAEPTALDERHYRPSAELYAWPLAAALGLALLALGGGLRRRRP